MCPYTLQAHVQVLLKIPAVMCQRGATLELYILKHNPR